MTDALFYSVVLPVIVLGVAAFGLTIWKVLKND